MSFAMVRLAAVRAYKARAYTDLSFPSLSPTKIEKPTAKRHHRGISKTDQKKQTRRNCFNFSLFLPSYVILFARTVGEIVPE